MSPAYRDDASTLARGAAFMLDLGATPYPPLVAADAAAGLAVVGVQESATRASVSLFDPRGGFRPADDVTGELGWVGLADVAGGARGALPRAAWISGPPDPEGQSISGSLTLGETDLREPSAAASHRDLPDCTRFQAVLPAGRTLWTRPLSGPLPYLCGSELRAYSLGRESGTTLDTSVPAYGDYLWQLPSPSLRYVAFQTATDDGGEDIVVYDVARGTQAVPLSPDGALDTAVWSPSERAFASLLFRRLPDGTYDAIPGDDGPLDIGSAVVVSTPDGQDTRVLSTPHHVTAPTWSPDGGALALLDVTVGTESAGTSAGGDANADAGSIAVQTHGLWVWQAGGPKGAGGSEAGSPVAGGDAAPRLVWTPADPTLQYDITAWASPRAIIVQAWRTDPNGNPDVRLLAVDPVDGSSREVGTVDWNGAGSAVVAAGGLVFVSGNEVDWWKDGRRETLLRLDAAANYAEPLAQVGDGVLVRLSSDSREELVWTPLP